MDRHRAVDRRQEAFGISRPFALDQRLACIAVHAFQDFRRLFTRDALIQHHAERVDIGPGPLFVSAHILFERGVGRGVEGDGGAGRFTRFKAGRTEVDQDRATIFVHHDVGRLDVPVQHAHAVRAVETFRDRQDHLGQRFLVEPLAVLDQLGQRSPVLEIHHHVGGAVNLEQAAHADDVGMARRSGEVPEEFCFLHEFLQAQRVHFLGVGIDRNDSRVLVPFTNGAGEILLDCNEFVEIDPATLVYDAKAADAQHVLQSPFAKHCSRRQCLVAVYVAHCPRTPIHYCKE